MGGESARGGSEDRTTGRPDFGEQARQVSRNLDAALRAGHSRPELVVNTTVLVANASDFGEC
jgi:enamine deaminase RidA (YjgF/YER057c/UK114 family)